MMSLELNGYRCERCGHEWLPRSRNQEKSQQTRAFVQNVKVHIGMFRERTRLQKRGKLFFLLLSSQQSFVED